MYSQSPVLQSHQGTKLRNKRINLQEEKLLTLNSLPAAAENAKTGRDR